MSIDYRNSATFQKGVEAFKEKYSTDDHALIDDLYNFSPSLADIVFSDGLYGTWIEKTPTLSVQQKELVVFGALATLGGKEIRLHTKNLLNVGLTKEQIKEILVLLTLYIGVPKVIYTMDYVIEAFKEYDTLNQRSL